MPKLSQIAPAGAPPLLTDQVVGVSSGNVDNLFSLSQLKSTIVSAQADPLFLTQGLGVTATNPTVFGNATYRRAVDITTTYNILDSDIGFTDQVALGIQLNFNAGLNIFNSGDPGANAQAKYTPIALNVGGEFIGAGEKFMLATAGNFWSMGDAFTWSADCHYAGGPIGGDEGQGITPAMLFTQPDGISYETITQVVRTTYTATITAPVTGSQNAQNIPVSTTTGANVGDWIILNQSIPGLNSAIWAMQILSISPGVSINGVCPLNCNIGCTITPALCLNLNGGGYQFGEGRTLVNYSGASYSTGTIASTSGGAIFGQGGASWSNGMVGGSALNIGAIYFDPDSLTTTVFSPGAPCRSIYQITTIVNPTELGLYSNSAAGDGSYFGRATAGSTYKIIPGARVLKVNPGGSPSFTVVCETSTHTWTVGDTVECAICPFPDVHGFDLRLGQWNAGGIRRSYISLRNPGARTFATGIELSGQPTYIGNVSNPQVDGFSFAAGIQISSSESPILIFGLTSPDGTSIVGSSAITLIASGFGTGVDAGIKWPGNPSCSLSPVLANGGMDFFMGSNSLIRTVGNGVNPDGNSPQTSITGYLQLCGFSSFQPYLRMGGSATAGATATGTFDLAITTDGVTTANTLQFFVNSPPAAGLFGVTSGGSGWFAGANVPAAAAATAGVNKPSQVMQLSASVWDGSFAENKTCQIVAYPDSLSTTNTTVSMQFRVWDQAGTNSANAPNVPMSLSSLGLLTFGKDNFITGGDTRVTIDPSGLTAPRAVTVPDTAGGMGVVVAGSHTPASSGAAGTPGTIEFDGTYLYVCVGANTWVRSALTGGW